MKQKNITKAFSEKSLGNLIDYFFKKMKTSVYISFICALVLTLMTGTFRLTVFLPLFMGGVFIYYLISYLRRREVIFSKPVSGAKEIERIKPLEQQEVKNALTYTAINTLYLEQASAVKHPTMYELTSEQEEALNTFKVTPFMKDQLLKSYPHLSNEAVLSIKNGLKEYFLICTTTKDEVAAMPSQAVDALWHAFILETQLYAKFCESLFNRFFHHIPNSSEPKKEVVDRSRVVTWVTACVLAGIDPEKPASLPLLYQIDLKLEIPDGFYYYRSVDWKEPATKVHSKEPLSELDIDFGADTGSTNNSHSERTIVVGGTVATSTAAANQPECEKNDECTEIGVCEADTVKTELESSAECASPTESSSLSDSSEVSGGGSSCGGSSCGGGCAGD